MVTDHTNQTEQSSPERTEQESSTQQEQGERRWYAIHTYSGYENKVKSHLEARINSMEMRNKIFRVIVPMEEEVEIKQGQRRTVQRKVFPGYVLVEMVMSDEAWYVVPQSLRASICLACARGRRKLASLREPLSRL